MLSIKTPREVAVILAERLREQRLQQGWSREEMSERSGVSVASIKRFELTGEIALIRLLQLCMILRAIDDFNDVLKMPEIKSIAELKRRQKPRQRGKRRSQ